MPAARAAEQILPFHDDCGVGVRTVAQRGRRSAEDGDDRHAPRHGEVHGCAVVAHDETGAVDQRHERLQVGASGQVDHTLGLRLVFDVPRHADVVLAAAQDHAPVVAGQGTHHLGVTGRGPAFRMPDRSGAHDEHGLGRTHLRPVQQTLCFRAGGRGIRHVRGAVAVFGIAPERAHQTEHALDLVAVRVALHRPMIETAARATAEPDPPRDAGQRQQQAGAERFVRGDREGERLRAQQACGAQQAPEAASGAAFVVHQDAVDRGVVPDERLRLRSRQHAQRRGLQGAAQGVQQRRGQHDVAQKPGLSDQEPFRPRGGRHAARTFRKRATRLSSMSSRG